jgi:hypothetical protein
MSWEILLNNIPHTFTAEDLPALIHGEKGAGASLFSLSLLKQLYDQGEPLLVLSSGEHVKTEFTNLLKKPNALGEITNETEITSLQDKQVIYLLNDHQTIASRLIAELEDFSERIVLINKFEGFTKETLTLFFGHAKTIFCGDLNTSDAKEPLLQLKYNTKIFYSPLHNDFRLHLPEDLEKYHGYYQGRIDQGTVLLRQNT